MKAVLAITFTLALALLLDTVSFYPWYNWVRPDFTLMVMVYWIIAMPERMGVFVAAVIGLFQDGLTASFIGEHVIAYSVIGSISVLAYQRLRVYDVWQQAGFLFLLIGLSNLIQYWISMLTSSSNNGWWFLLSAFISALLWPWLMIMLRAFRRQLGLVTKLI